MKLRRFFHRNYLWLGGVVCGIICTLQLSAWIAVSVIWLLLAGLLSVKRCWRELTVWVIASTGGWGSCWLHEYWNQVAVRNNRLEKAVVEITDSSALGTPLYAGESLPFRVLGKVMIGQHKRQVELYFPEKYPNPGVCEGESWSVTGNFYVPDPPGEFFMYDHAGRQWRDVSAKFANNGYRNYLRSRGVAGTVVVEKIEFKHGQASFFSRLRRSAAIRLDRYINDPAHRAIAGAVTLGIRWRLTKDIKDEFARVGTAHLFSVSGLHVGVLAVLLLLAIRSLPMFWHVLAVSSLVGYVLLTGGNAPAIRAFAMVLAVEFLRSRLLYVKSLELLSLICAGLLLANPYYIVDAGFQYSFVVTALLIAAAEPGRLTALTGSGCAVYWSDFSNAKKNLLKWRGRLAGAVFFAAVAAAGSGILVLYHQNLFFACSMLANLLVVPVLTPLFGLALLKMVMPWGINVINFLLEALIDYLEWLIAFFDRWTDGNDIARPHYMLVIAAEVLLLLFLLLYRHRAGVWAWGGMLLLWGCLLLYSTTLAPERLLVIFSGDGSNEPAAAIIDPAGHRANLLNINRSSAYLLHDINAFYGISRIERLDFGRAVAGCVNGLPVLHKNMTVDEYRLPGGTVRSRVFQEYTRDLHLVPGAESGRLSLNGINACEMQILPEPSGNWLVQCQNQSFRITRTAVPRAYIIAMKPYSTAAGKQTKIKK